MATNSKKDKRRTRPKSARLTADNVVRILQQVIVRGGLEGKKWEFIGRYILNVSYDKRKEITSTCTTDEQRLQVMVTFWLQKCPYASWRYLVWKLEHWRNPDLAKQIYGFAEPLTDPNLNVKTLMSLLSTVRFDRLKECLQIPDSKRREIQQKSKTEEDKKLIQWYLDCSPFADFTDLAGELYYLEETSALDQVKRYVQTVPEPTLTLSNVAEAVKLVKDSKWDISGFPFYLNIPRSKREEIHSLYRDVSQRKRAFLKHFLEDYPCPSWKLIAYAVYRVGEFEALEVIQRDYFKGTSESRRHFKKAMKEGFVISEITKLLLFGAAGVGKTCTKANMLGQALPAVRISTPLAKRSVQVHHAKITSSKWEELSREDRDKIIAQAVYCCELDDLPEYLEKEGIQHVDIQTEQENAEVEPLPKPTKLSHNHSQDPISSENELPQEASLELTDTPTARPVMATTDEKLLVLMDGCSLDDPFDKINRVQITDSGGQPQFHEVLPIFLRGTSVYVFFQKLSEKLDAYSTVEYFDENGQSVCTPYQASHTNLQIFQHCLRVMHSQRSNLKGGKEKSARIIVIGTFEDEAHKCSEKIETKNKRFLELLLPSFKKEVVYYDLNQPKKVIFPLNARNPGEAGEKIIDQVRSLISTECTADPVKVPLQWHALESLLEEMAEILKRDVLTKEECFQVAKEKLHFDEDSFDAALEYLDQLNMIFYFPEILPNVIFANTQVLLDKVTELVLAIHQLRQGLTKMPFTANWQRFNDHALVSEEFLAQIHFSKHYVPRCFTEKELVVLFNELLVFAKFNETEFFMPALLRMLSKEEVDKYRVDKSSAAAPVVITFSGDVPCLGVFCASIVFLLSSKNCQWELKMTDSSTPSCLYRNCVEFKIPNHPGTVIFIDAFKHFEIHLRLSECAFDLAKTICLLVRSAIFEALHNADLALHYKISEPSLCLLCPCKLEECHAAITIPNYYICSKDSDVCGPLSLNHCVWSEEPQSPPTSDRHLTESDIPQLMEKLAPHAAKWWKIGTALGFLPYELELIRSSPMLMYGAPASFLAEMLTKWVQWSPETMHLKYATVTDLRQALRSELVGLAALSETV